MNIFSGLSSVTVEKTEDSLSCYPKQRKYFLNRIQQSG